MTRAGRTLAQACRFLCDEAGSVLVLWIMSLVAVIGFVALVFDMGRVQVTHGELQSFADSVALAAAGELDGSADAIARATAAAAEVADTNVYGGDGTLSGSSDYTLTFLTGLPADDTADPSSYVLSTPYDASDDAAATLVRVEVTPVSLGVSFLAATNALTGAGGGATMSMAAEAIAGFTMEACDITPLMFCVPNASWEAEDNIGQQILLRSGGTIDAWGPGDFGFLDVSAGAVGSTCAGLSGANLVGCLLGAENNVTQCYSQRGVDLEPGQKEGLNASVFNTRFDRFTSTMNGEVDDPDYTVAPNIVSGEVVTNCANASTEISANSIGLPHDSNQVSCVADPSTCPRFGSGTWDYDTYYDTNHGNGDGTLSTGEDAGFVNLIPTAFAGTRYGTYLAEIAQAGGAMSGNDILTKVDATSTYNETGRNSCSSNRSSDPRRRVVIAAGIDCVANGIAGAATNVPVKEFAELFMTNPIGSGEGTGNKKTFNIWVEVIGSAGKSGFGGAGSGGIFRDVVQLYR